MHFNLKNIAVQYNNCENDKNFLSILYTIEHYNFLALLRIRRLSFVHRFLINYIPLFAFALWMELVISIEEARRGNRRANGCDKIFVIAGKPSTDYEFTNSRPTGVTNCA